MSLITPSDRRDSLKQSSYYQRHNTMGIFKPNWFYQSFKMLFSAYSRSDNWLFDSSLHVLHVVLYLFLLIIFSPMIYLSEMLQPVLFLVSSTMSPLKVSASLHQTVSDKQMLLCIDSNAFETLILTTIVPSLIKGFRTKKEVRYCFIDTITIRMFITSFSFFH